MQQYVFFFVLFIVILSLLNNAFVQCERPILNVILPSLLYFFILNPFPLYLNFLNFHLILRLSACGCFFKVFTSSIVWWLLYTVIFRLQKKSSGFISAGVINITFFFFVLKFVLTPRRLSISALQSTCDSFIRIIAVFFKKLVWKTTCFSSMLSTFFYNTW